ncbi:hypothetical protein [Cellulomonas sp. Y8]|uniref:hypothetical protein n=1 Tax=Cellulomonas sp. Y8 TaxID=2591145 RepID=UPI001AEFDFD5|nr:hypothetical protein [Cellulomonas sp. Y8]
MTPAATDHRPDPGGPSPGVLLCWIPLGAGGPRVVRASGRAYEAVAALRDRRPRRTLVHAALLVRPATGPEVAVEVAPAWGQPAGDRGVVATGPVGARVLGRSRLFRYEVRCWAGGSVPDLAWAVARRCATTDPRVAAALLAAAPGVPVRTWGGRAPGVRDMWTSNSVVAWLLAAAGLDPEHLGPPPGCRAPGWDAGVRAAPSRRAALPTPSGPAAPDRRRPGRNA